MIGIPVGLLYANAVEWLVHRYVLHGPGKNPDSFWRFHWAEHHKNSRKNNMYDADYEKSIFDWNARGKEAFGIACMGALHVSRKSCREFALTRSWEASARQFIGHASRVAIDRFRKPCAA